MAHVKQYDSKWYDVHLFIMYDGSLIDDNDA